MTQAERLASRIEYQMELTRMLALAAECARMTAQLVATMKGTK